MGLEVCCTLGMLTKEQAIQLKEAGLTAYNHNLDTSREFYPQVWWAENTLFEKNHMEMGEYMTVTDKNNNFSWE